MNSNLRPSGIEALGDMARGSHFGMFYETEQDLLEMLSLYFKPGLVNNEFCLWITPDSSIERQGMRSDRPFLQQTSIWKKAI